MTARMSEGEFQLLFPHLHRQSAPTIASAKTKKKSQPEGTVKKDCMALLAAWGCDVLSTPTGMAFREQRLKSGELRRYPIRYGKKGLGDTCAISPYGRWIEVETKYATNSLSDDQKRRRNEVQRRGGVYIVARKVEALEQRKTEILAKAWNL